jgi:GT2 family glycosyltransferase
MITASVVIYKSSVDELKTIIDCTMLNTVDILYIIDNSPTNELEKIVQSYSNTRLVYIPCHSNPGFGAAHNIALKLAIELEADYHVVLNPDLFFEKDIIRKLTDYADVEENVGLVIPKVIYPNGDIQYLCKLLPTPMDWIGRRFIPWKKIFQRRNYKFELRGSGYDKIMNIPYLSGCFMFFRVSVLKNIGLFDERMFMYCEDTDITRRIYQKYLTIFYPEIKIIHEYKKGSYKSIRLLWIHIKSTIYYFNKWGWFWDKERKRINDRVLAEYIN